MLNKWAPSNAAAGRLPGLFMKLYTWLREEFKYDQKLTRSDENSLNCFGIYVKQDP